MGSCNCYVCQRGFPTIDLLYAHIGEHPGRTVEEMERAAEAWGRLKGTDLAWMLREAEHNDEHEVTTEVPGFAVNDALAHLTNREKAAVVGAKAKKASLNAAHGIDGPEDAETPTVITEVVASPLTRAEWAEHDRIADAQRKPYAEMAQDFAARSLYKAREIPYAEETGNYRAAEYARREDAAEDQVEAEREQVLSLMDERDRLVKKDAFDPVLPDSTTTRDLFRDHKSQLMKERAAESAAMFAAQYPEEAAKAGVKAPKLTRAQTTAIEQQKADAEAATVDARRASGIAPAPTPPHLQVNEGLREPVKPPEPPPADPKPAKEE
jgi:hypothetical protein